MVRQTVARIDLNALKSNYHHIVGYLAADGAVRAPGVIAVVKANAYGHGAAQVALALEAAGADLLACADIEEGAALRAAGARAVQAAAERYKQRVRYHLKIDTGMNRLGFRFDNLKRTLPDLLASPNLDLEAVYTHFATADDPESPLFNEQRVRFERARGEIMDMERKGREVRKEDLEGSPYV